MKHATNGEVLLFKRPIETKFSKLLTGGVTDIFSGLNEDEVVDFEFISNPQAIQTRYAESEIFSHQKTL